MLADSYKRKLTAILSADVKGYSRLMREDEAETVKIITAYRKLMGDTIEQHRGRVIDSPGDNVLAEFASVVDAVQCAVTIQDELKTRNAELSESRRMQFRIGINLGDVIEEEGRIYGDGVNIAARVEGLAEAGGICLSRTAFDQVKDKVKLGFKYLGEHSVKNITEPVRVYCVLTESEAAGKIVDEKRLKNLRRRHPAIAGALVVLVIAGALTLWHFQFRRPAIEPARVDKMALPLPDKPSIAVIPFFNMSGSADQDFYCDGFTDQIITSLSKIPHLFVIASNSTFTYKGKPVKVQQVAEDLGVRYVLEGSIQKVEKKIRIRAQLVDAVDGRHMWAESYDRAEEDVFAIQDEIAGKIITSLQGKLTSGEYASAIGKSTKNLEALQLFWRAQYHLLRLTKEDNALCRKYAQQAIELDPGFAAAWAELGFSHLFDARIYGSSSMREQSNKLAGECVQKALTLNPLEPKAFLLPANMALDKKDYDKAIEHAAKMLEINPNDPWAFNCLGTALGFAGRHEEAIVNIKKTMRLTPFYHAMNLRVFGFSSFLLRRYDDALWAGEKFLDRVKKAEVPGRLGNLMMTTIYSELGQDEKARMYAAEMLKVEPDFSLERIKRMLPYKNQSDMDRILNAARKAGLPERPVEPAKVDKAALPLPDKPSIAVLPFFNMSGGADQDLFCDGFTDQIITSLAKIPHLFIIASNSSFTYKGKPVKVQDVAKELGVRYVLEGSIQKAEKKIRIRVQLIDAVSGHHMWAENYDRTLEDVFSVQDEIAGKIITSLQVTLTSSEYARATGKATKNLQALQYWWMAQAHYIKLKKEDNAIARQYAEKALELDPQYSTAWAELGFTHLMDSLNGWSSSSKESMKSAEECARKAFSLNPSELKAQLLACRIAYSKREHDKAIEYAEKAANEYPNDPYALNFVALSMMSAGRHVEAVASIRKAMRQTPHYPPHFLFNFYSSFLLRQYDDAIWAGEQMLEASRKGLLNERMG